MTNEPPVADLTDVYVRLECDLLVVGDSILTDRHHASNGNYDADDPQNQIGGIIPAYPLSGWLRHGMKRVVQQHGSTACHPGESSAMTTVAMVGAMVPDLNRLKLVISAETVEAVLVVPFTWRPFHTVGSAGIVTQIAALTVRPEYRQPVILLLALDVLSHFVLDMFLIPPAGTFPYFWPVTDADIALPGLYRSGDLWMISVAIVSSLSV